MMKLILSTLAVALLIAPFGKAQAETLKNSDEKAVVVASFSGLGEIVKDAEYLAGLAGFKGNDLAQFKFGLMAFTGGLDHSRPWGLAVNVKGKEFKPVVFVPVTNLKQLMTMMQAIPQIDIEEGKNGIYEVDAGPRTILIKESNGWAFIALDPEHLKNLPKNPVELLGGLEKKYDIAIKANIDNVPEEFIGKAIDGLKMGIQLAMQPLPDESDEDFKIRKDFLKSQIDKIVKSIKDSKAVTLGLSIDREKKTIFGDFVYTAKSGTDLSKQFNALANVKTEYAGFILPDAAVSFNLTSKISSEDAKNLLQTFDMLKKKGLQEIDKSNDFPDEDTKKAVKKIVGNLIDVFESTLKEGKIDGAGSVALKPGAMTFIVGGRVADGAVIQKAFNEVVKMLENEPDFPGVKNAGTYNGVTLKTMTVPVNDEKAEKVFGDKLTVVFGTGKKSVYFAMGTDAVKVLKTAIDNSGPSKSKKVDVLSVAFGIGTILNFAADVDDNPVLTMMAKEANNFKGKDRVILSEKIIKDGVKLRFELEEGVLNIIAKGAAAAVRMRNGF